MIEKRVVCCWSGGVDSTVLAAKLLVNGYRVILVTLNFYREEFVWRERQARAALLPLLSQFGYMEDILEKDGNFLWNFSPDGVEIPRRNRLIMDHLIETECKKRNCYYIGLGEYIGAESWVVRDHVADADADARALAAYLYHEYGLDYRLLTLADFGESRFKTDRVRMGAGIIGEAMFWTTNCLENTSIHCGACYKCVERYVAFSLVFGRDRTTYLLDPERSERYPLYLEQMKP